MSVDGISSEVQARALSKKRKEVEDEKNALEIDKAQANRARLKEAAASREKLEVDLVEISSAGEKQSEMVKKMNSERVRSLNDNSQKSYEALAGRTAEQIKLLEGNATKAIEDHRKSTMEKVKFATDQTEDSFYRVNSLNPVLAEGEHDFSIKMAMPEKDAKNLFVSGGADGTLKLSLARRFQEEAKSPEEARTTRTSSFQTVVETLALPGPYDGKGIKKEYAEGVLTVKVPKLVKANPLSAEKPSETSEKKPTSSS